MTSILTSAPEKKQHLRHVIGFVDGFLKQILKHGFLNIFFITYFHYTVDPDRGRKNKHGTTFAPCYRFWLIDALK